MEKTTVTEISYRERKYPIAEYACDKCGSTFIDHNGNYHYCPYCGRKIVEGVKFKNE